MIIWIVGSSRRKKIFEIKLKCSEKKCKTRKTKYICENNSLLVTSIRHGRNQIKKKNGFNVLNHPRTHIIKIQNSKLMVQTAYTMATWRVSLHFVRLNRQSYTRFGLFNWPRKKKKRAQKIEREYTGVGMDRVQLTNDNEIKNKKKLNIFLDLPPAIQRYNHLYYCAQNYIAYELAVCTCWPRTQLMTIKSP